MPALIRDLASMAGAAQAAMRRVGEMVLDDARAHAPEETGALKASGEVQEVAPGAVRITFTEPYAARQHYLDYGHPGGGEQFFLLNAMDRARPLIEQAVADEVRSRLGG